MKEARNKKKIIKLLILSLGSILGLALILLLSLIYYKQEEFIFFPEKLPANYSYNFSHNVPFEEKWITVDDNGTRINGVLFKTNKKPKGLIFYAHGNAGSMRQWGELAPYYTRLGYDFFTFDYRGYGKSNGRITDENQFYNDVSSVFDTVSRPYPQEEIVIIGYSIGTAAAARTASHNTVKRLILNAPYYDLKDIKNKKLNFIPSSLIKYPFQTHTFLSNTHTPIAIIHGEKDSIIPIESSKLLRQHIKHTDKYYSIENQGHSNLEENKEYHAILTELL